MSDRAFARVASVLKLRRALTSVLTRPGTIFSVSRPKKIANLSSTLSSSASYSDICAALRMRLGLVVASCGVYSRIDSKSPVSATMIVCFRKESR